MKNSHPHVSQVPHVPQVQVLKLVTRHVEDFKNSPFYKGGYRGIKTPLFRQRHEWLTSNLILKMGAGLIQILYIRYVDLLKQADRWKWRIQYVYIILLMPEHSPKIGDGTILNFLPQFNHQQKRDSRLGHAIKINLPGRLGGSVDHEI